MFYGHANKAQVLLLLLLTHYSTLYLLFHAVSKRVKFQLHTLTLLECPHVDGSVKETRNG